MSNIGSFTKLKEGKKQTNVTFSEMVVDEFYERVKIFESRDDWVSVLYICLLLLPQ